MIKGHSRIELTDILTGVVTAYDNDNIVTNALNLYLSSGGIPVGDCFADISVHQYPLWQSLIGGIMLFDSELVQSVDTVTIPAGVTMVGNGAYGRSNTSGVTELGSYNTTESGEQEDGSIKMVWDFTTAQANGSIRSAALSSRAGGFIGAGNAKSGQYLAEYNTNKVNDKDFNGLFNGMACASRVIYHPLSEAGDRKKTYNYILYADYVNNCIYYIVPDTLHYESGYDTDHFTNTGNIVINKYRLGLSAVSLKERYVVRELLGTCTVAMPVELKNWLSSGTTLYRSNFFKVLCNNQNIYIVFSNATGTVAGSSMYVWKIDAHNNSSLYKIINNTGTTIKYNYAIGVTSDEYILFKDGGEASIYKIGLADSTEVLEIPDTGTQTTYYCLNDKLYSTAFVKSNVNACTVVDAKKNTVMPVNGNAYSASIYTVSRPVIGNPLFELSSDETESFVVRRNCNYLATINNLSAPVVKTAGQTMKVIYTITF